MKNNRDIFRKIRVTQEEDDYIKLCAFQKNYSSVSEYIRTCAIRPINIDDKISKDFHKEINRIGINFNQITRKLNQEKFEKLENKEIIQVLFLISEELSSISQQLEQALNLYGDLRK